MIINYYESTLTTGGKVRFDHPNLICNCSEYNGQSKKWLRGGDVRSKPSAPLCAHMRQMLLERADTLPLELPSIEVHITRAPDLSMSVDLENTDDDNLISCLLHTMTFDGKLFVDHGQIFLGYLPKNSSRQDIRDLILPVLAERYFESPCPRCNKHPGDIKRNELLPHKNDRPKPLTMAAYHAGYMLRFGCCVACNDDDLIPNASPNPPEPTVMAPGWPVSMGVGKKPRTKPPKWASATATTWTTPTAGGPSVSGSFTVSTTDMPNIWINGVPYSGGTITFSDPNE